jgi:hypothetical protein
MRSSVTGGRGLYCLLNVFSAAVVTVKVKTWRLATHQHDVSDADMMSSMVLVCSQKGVLLGGMPHRYVGAIHCLMDI